MTLRSKVGAGIGLNVRGTVITQPRGSSFHWRPRVIAVLQDDFAGVSGIQLNAHAPVLTPAGNWVNTVPDTGSPVVTTTTIDNGQAAISAGAEGVYIDTGLADFDLQCSITFGSATRCGIILRGQSDGNMLILRFRMPESLVELTESTAGVIAVVGTSQALTYTNGQKYAFRVRAEGQAITVYRDGVQVLAELSVTNYQTQTRQGFTSFGSSFDERYNDFMVSPLTGSTPK